METKELKITIPEGQEIDWQESAKQEKIVFKKKDTKPRSWEEYCNNFRGTFYYIQDDRDSIGASFTPIGLISAYKNILPSKELAEAFLAMMQLMSLRQTWISDWKSDWNDIESVKWCITQCQYEFRVDDLTMAYKVLSFPTKEMATDFMNTFKDLLEIAKPLI